MKRSNEKSLGEAIREMLHQLRLNEKLNETRLTASWEQIMGRMIASHTENMFLKDKKIFIKLDSPALKNELMMSKTKLLERINEEVKEMVVEDVVFL